MQKFCFLCGKRTDKLIEGYCEECYEKEFKLIRLPEKISIEMCHNCEKIKDDNKWKSITLETAITNKVKVLGRDVKLSLEKTDNTFHIYARGFLKNHDNLKEEKHLAQVDIKKSLCPTCIKERSGYHESILQLRGDVTPDILNFVERQISEDVFYKTKSVKGGLDYYISKKAVAESIANSLKKSFKAVLKRSFKQVSKKEGKNIYKDIISVRI